MPAVKLNRHESIVAVIPEYVSGPGWSNRPLWVHIVNHANNNYRCECLQPDEQTTEQRILFPVLAAAHNAMLAQVEVKKAKS